MMSQITARRNKKVKALRSFARGSIHVRNRLISEGDRFHLQHLSLKHMDDGGVASKAAAHSAHACYKRAIFVRELRNRLLNK